MFVLLSQSECVLLVSRGLPCPQLSFSEFQAFRLRSFLELRHGGCSVWLAHGSSLLMVFGSLAPLWCLASVPSEHARLVYLPSKADGSCASVLAERTHWKVCIGSCRANTLCWSSGRVVCFGIGLPEHAHLMLLPFEAYGSCASVPAERTHFALVLWKCRQFQHR